MSDRQRNQHVATIRSPAEGELSVYVARWLQRPTPYDDAPRPTQVMWIDGNSSRYLPPERARAFAEALVKAADEADKERR